MELPGRIQVTLLGFHFSVATEAEAVGRIDIPEDMRAYASYRAPIVHNVIITYPHVTHTAMILTLLGWTSSALSNSVCALPGSPMAASTLGQTRKRSSSGARRFISYALVQNPFASSEGIGEWGR